MKRSVKAIVAATCAAFLCAAPAISNVAPVINSISASAYYIPNAYADIDHNFIATISYDHTDDQGRTIYNGCHLDYRFETLRTGESVIMVCGSDLAVSIVNVPNRVKLNGQIYWVGGIAEGAFTDKNGTQNGHGAGLTKLILSNATYLKEIKPNAFKNCTALTSVDLKSGNLYWIDNSAFENCSGITELNLPSTVREVGSYAFMNSGIKNLTFNYNSRYNLKLNQFAFGNCTSIRSIKNNNDIDYTNSSKKAFQGVNKNYISFSTGRSTSSPYNSYVYGFINYFF